MITFGERLRQAREKAGLSLQEVSARTKIRASILDAIERVDLARLPAGFYTKAFLRAYAAEVRLDPNEILEQYASLFDAPPLRPQPAEVFPDPQTAPTTAEVFGRVRPRLAPVGMFALAGILLFFVYNLRYTDPAIGSSGPEPGAAATSGSTPSTAPPAPETIVIEEPAAAPNRPPDLLTIEVRPTALLWLEGTADGERVVRRLLQPQERVVFTARHDMRLLIGDAGAFDFSINGRPGRPLGGPGEVRTVDVRPDNYQEFLAGRE